MLTSENIVNAVNAAGFETEEEFTEALTLAKKVLTRNRLSYAMARLQRERADANRLTDQQIAELQSRIADLDEEIATSLPS